MTYSDNKTILTQLASLGYNKAKEALVLEKGLEQFKLRVIARNNANKNK